MCVRIRASNHFQQQKQQQVYPDDRDVRVLYGTVPRPRSRWMGGRKNVHKGLPTAYLPEWAFFLLRHRQVEVPSTLKLPIVAGSSCTY